jgi:hypothetical protein
MLPGGTERLPRIVGRDRALEALLTIGDYDGTQAIGAKVRPDFECRMGKYLGPANVQV